MPGLSLGKAFTQFLHGSGFMLGRQRIHGGTLITGGGGFNIARLREDLPHQFAGSTVGCPLVIGIDTSRR